MARLLTAGFELGSAAVDTALTGAGNFTATTADKRGGDHSGAFTGTLASSDKLMSYVFTGAAGTTYYARMAVKFTAFSVSGVTPRIIGMGSSTQPMNLAYISVSSSGVLGANFPSVGNLGHTFQAQLNTWYVLELAYKFGTSGVANSYGGWRVDGTVIDESATINTTAGAPGAIAFGASATGTASPSFAYYGDDIAINDSTGSAQNSWPGLGLVVLLVATADSARGTNWTAGAGGTTNLWDAVDNLPPVGLVLASATNTSQIKNAAKDIAGTYDATLQPYTARLGASDTVVLTRPLAAIGNSTATARSMGVTGVSNPAAAEATGNTPAFAAGTYPTSWVLLKGTPAYGPTVTMGTAPVVRIRKNTSTTDSTMACFLGLEVEYTPGSDTTPPITTYVSETATKVSAVTGYTTTTVTWSVNEACQAWQIREVADASTPIGSAGAIVKSGGAVPAATNQNTTIANTDLPAGEGAKLYKIFAEDLAGNWST